ncbi:MAG: PQQ-binding-like beta-propeller repeat protein [Armatimonadetes bacterium]|nr:PQQ-binding-like beta-propeller repeat protein [Armatimonadota bacterium]
MTLALQCACRTAFLFLVSAPIAANAQFNLAWADTLDGGRNLCDYATNSVADSLGNIYVVGTVNSYGADEFADISLQKFSPTGVLLWTRLFDGPAHSQDIGIDLALGGDGSVNVVGRVLTADASSDIVTLKYRATDGALLWSRQIDGPAHSVDTGCDIAADASGNVFVTGEVWNDAEFYSNGDYCTVKYTADGSLAWSRLYDGPANYIAISDQPQNIAVDRNGDVVVSGDSPGPSNIDDIVTVKYRGSDGAQLWEQRYTGLGANDNAVGLEIASNGDPIVTGNTFQNDYKIVVIRYDSVSGVQQWAKVDVFPHHGQLNRFYSMALDQGNNPVISLTYDPDVNESNLNYNIQTTKYDFATGERIWSVSYGNSDRYDAQGARAVAVDKLGNVVVAGSSLVLPHTRFALWYYRGSDGALLWTKDYAFPFDSDKPSRVFFDRFGNIVSCGTTTNNNTSLTDVFVTKWTRNGTPQVGGGHIIGD